MEEVAERKADCWDFEIFTRYAVSTRIYSFVAAQKRIVLSVHVCFTQARVCCRRRYIPAEMLPTAVWRMPSQGNFWGCDA